MTKRTPHFKTAEVVKQRGRFIAKHNAAAVSVLAAVSREICENPEKGTETSKKGVFCRRLPIMAPHSQVLFVCEVIYTFTSRQVGWEGFAWKC